jgi:hypothetical protein
MLPKKVKLKNQKIRTFEDGFFILNFLGSILSLVQIRIFEISINSQFFYTQYDLFQEKISPLRRAIFQILDYKTPNKEETAPNIENYLF